VLFDLDLSVDNGVFFSSSYFYYGIIDLRLLQEPLLIRLMIAMHDLNLEMLLTTIQDYFVRVHHEWTRSNAIILLRAIFHYNGFEQLRSHIFEILRRDPKMVTDCDHWLSQ
jgi:hypothetical protein